MNKKVLGSVVATAVAGLLFTGSVMAETTAPAPEAAKTVKCMGVNECKGKGACASAKNACAGKNGCKGQGVTLTGTEADCTSAKGTVEKPAAPTPAM